MLAARRLGAAVAALWRAAGCVLHLVTDAFRTGGCWERTSSRWEAFASRSLASRHWMWRKGKAYTPAPVWMSSTQPPGQWMATSPATGQLTQQMLRPALGWPSPRPARGMSLELSSETCRGPLQAKLEHLEIDWEYAPATWPKNLKVP